MFNRLAKLPEGWEHHSFSYRFDDKLFSMSIPARSEEEARDRFLCLSNGIYDGQIYGEYPVDLGWYVKFLCWWKTFWGPRNA